MLRLLFNVNIGKLVLFEFMYVQRLDIWRQITRSIIFLFEDLVMKPGIKSLDIFNEKVFLPSLTYKSIRCVLIELSLLLDFVLRSCDFDI